MIDANSLARVREQFGIPQGGLKQQSILNNRVASFDSAVGVAPQTTQTSTPEVSPRNPLIDALVQGVGAIAKKTGEGLSMIGEGIDYGFGTPGKAAGIALGHADDVPYGFSEQVGQTTEGLTGSKTAGTIAGIAAGFAEPLPGPGKIKAAGKAAELLDKVLTEHITSSKQIIQNLPKEEVARLGGIKSLLDRTRINIADALKAYKLPEAEKEVRNLDISKFKSLDEFEEAAKDIVHPHTLFHGIKNGSTFKSGGTSAELGKGYYLADTPEAASTFGEAGVDVTLPSSINTYRMKTDVAKALDNDKLYTEFVHDVKSPEAGDFMGWLQKKHGYDAIEAPLDAGGKQTILAPSAYEKLLGDTKSNPQLKR